MGFLKDISKWVSGGRKTDSVRSASIKLKVFNKRLMRQVKKLDITAKIARDKAVNLRRQGDMEGSKFHARNYLQVSKQSRSVEMFRTNLEGLQFKLDQANAVKDVSPNHDGYCPISHCFKKSVFNSSNPRSHESNRP